MVDPTLIVDHTYQKPPAPLIYLNKPVKVNVMLKPVKVNVMLVRAQFSPFTNISTLIPSLLALSVASPNIVDHKDKYPR